MRLSTQTDCFSSVDLQRERFQRNGCFQTYRCSFTQQAKPAVPVCTVYCFLLRCLNNRAKLVDFIFHILNVSNRKHFWQRRSLRRDFQTGIRPHSYFVYAKYAHFPRNSLHWQTMAEMVEERGFLCCNGFDISICIFILHIMFLRMNAETIRRVFPVENKNPEQHQVSVWSILIKLI